MSLNGLDSPNVARAYQAALNAPEGWFLLYYTSRDAVDALNNGTGGFSESRAALAAYAEPSPLHGFLQYRGRKALFKYVPAETSRLLQARSTVHFRTVSEKIAHDATLEFTTVEEFNEHALSIACSLPPPITSEPSPPTSSQRNIDAEPPPLDDRTLTGRMNGTKSPQAIPAHLISGRTPTPNSRHEDGVESRGSNYSVPQHYAIQTGHAHQSSFASRATEMRSDNQSVTSIPTSHMGTQPSLSGDRKYGGNNARPSTSDILRQGFSSWKPKVKLFPRPITEDQTQAPQSTSTRQRLPAAFRRKEGNSTLKQRGLKSATTTEISQADDDRSTVAGASPQKSMTRQPLSADDQRSVVSRSSQRDLSRVGENATSPSMPASGENPLRQAPIAQTFDMSAAEKQRLMRALQLRKEQQESEVQSTPSASELIAAARKNRDQFISSQQEKKADSGVEMVDTETPKKAPLSAKAENKPSSSSNSRSIPNEKSKGGTSTSAQKVERKGAKHVTDERDLNRSEKRRALLEPVHVDFYKEHSDTGSISDESLIDELETATVEEATQVSIPTSSPITPLVQMNTNTSAVSVDRRPSGNAVTSVLIRSTQNRSPPSRTPSEKVQDAKPQDKIPIAKKSNVSSDISRRIQALAELRGKEMNSVPAMKPGEDAGSPSFLAVYNRLPSLPENGKLATRSQAAISETSSLHKVSSHDAQKPESVSITARIVRPATSHGAGQRRRSASLDLHRSQVTVERQAVPAPLESIVDTALPTAPTSSRPPSRGSIASTPARNPSESRWNPFKRRESEAKSPVRSVRSSSNASNEQVDEASGESKQIRGSRLFGRLSRQSSPTRKPFGDTADHPTLMEEQLPPSPRLRPTIVVGDLNVQFPDILFWKRRWVEIDGSGNLIMSVSNRKESSRNVPRKYHMSEIKALFLPSRDGQELPHTVALDLFKGGTIQLACEDSVAQGQVFRRLHDAHRAERKPTQRTK